MNKRKLISIMCIIIVCVFINTIISGKFFDLNLFIIMIAVFIMNLMIYAIVYIIFKIYNAIKTGIINKHVKSVNIRKFISVLCIITPIMILGFPLYNFVKNNVNGLNINRYVANAIYGAILGDKMDNYQEDYEKTKDDVYVAKIKSRIDPNAVLSVKFSRKAILWPYVSTTYLVRHVIGSMMVRLSYPVFILPKDLNSGIYSWNFERGKA